MNFDSFLDSRFFELVATAIGILIFFIFRSVTDRIIQKQAKKHDLDKARSVYARKFFDVTYLLLLLLGLGFVWDIGFKGIFASFFAVAGVALFASWSMLSNITASVLLFFNFPFKIGSRIKIVDGENSISGLVKDITFFAIQIEDEKGDLVSYPNNVAIQKPIIQLKGKKSVK